MGNVNPLLTIGEDHPLYSRVKALLTAETMELNEKHQETLIRESLNLNWEQLITDYNAMASQEILAFLAFGVGSGAGISQGLIRRGLYRASDFILFAFNVLAVDTLHMIAGAPTKEVPEGEFANYACITGSLYPDPDKHPNVAAMDKAIPRRSNHSVTSDSLPVISGLKQVYILKTSAKKAKVLQGRGRPKKSS